VADSWIVKFPRGKHERDFLVLRNEAPYYEVARWFGVRTGAHLIFRDDSLLIPRFDRVPTDGMLIRHGLETLCSVADIPERGKRGDHIEFCKAITHVASDPRSELFEYLSRDILNSALRNVDNHGRNTAFIKKTGAKIELSPLYDFAPMFLDPVGINRASLWRDGIEKMIGRPKWHDVAQALADLNDPTETAAFLASHSEKVKSLPAIMKQCGVEEQVIEGVAMRCAEIGNDLEHLGKG
jgi:serine/threonine-protein kinase HipA